jgi:hypothetical protein
LATRNLIASLTVGLFAFQTAQLKAEGSFPAPLPGQVALANDPAFPPAPGQNIQKNDPAFPPVPGQTVIRNDPAFPPVNGGRAASFPAGGTAPVLGGGFVSGPASLQGTAPADTCMKNFVPLRAEAEKRGKLIKAAGERHAPPDEACKLIGNFSQAEIKMIKYVQTNASKCGIPPQIHDQLEKGHKNTETMEKKVCAVAEQQQKGPAGPSLSEVLGSSTTIPTATPVKHARGSVFDTLEGNVLER